jgi:hypothetical protein
MSSMKEELVTSAEAAHLLGISPRRIQQMVVRGLLRPHPSSPSTKKSRLFSLRDITALQEVRSKGHNPEAAFVIARESALETRALRREVERMRFVLGLDVPNIPTDRDTVVALLLKAEDALLDPPSNDHEYLLGWAKTFHGLSDAHFEAIAFHTKAKEPWRPFLSLAKKLCTEEDTFFSRADIELASIYRMLAATHRHLRQTAYFYIRDLNGKTYAAKLLPEVKGCPHEDVIAMAFNNLNWQQPKPPVNPGRCRPSIPTAESPERSRDWDG